MENSRPRIWDEVHDKVWQGWCSLLNLLTQVISAPADTANMIRENRNCLPSMHAEW
jgi:hypothetical protein